MTPPSFKYLMNDIPRGTTSSTLTSSLFAPPAEHLLINIVDSELDDYQRVAAVAFTKPPKELPGISTGSFRSKTYLGTICGGVDLTPDESGDSAFTGAGDVLLAELLAGFKTTDRRSTVDRSPLLVRSQS